MLIRICHLAQAVVIRQQGLSCPRLIEAIVAESLHVPKYWQDLVLRRPAQAAPAIIIDFSPQATLNWATSILPLRTTSCCILYHPVHEMTRVFQLCDTASWYWTSIYGLRDRKVAKTHQCTLSTVSYDSSGKL